MASANAERTIPALPWFINLRCNDSFQAAARLSSRQRFGSRMESGKIGAMCAHHIRDEEGRCMFFCRSNTFTTIAFVASLHQLLLLVENAFSIATVQKSVVHHLRTRPVGRHSGNTPCLYHKIASTIRIHHTNSIAISAGSKDRKLSSRQFTRGDPCIPS